MLPLEIQERLDAIRSEVGQSGIELIEVQFRRTGSRSVLTFIVDKPGGVTLDECADVNRRLGVFLDRASDAAGEDVLKGSYVLEVNSPGLDRPLRTPKDFERAKGEPVRVAWRAETGAGLVTVGTLREVDRESIELEDKQGKTVKISFGAVTKASRNVEI